MKALQKDVIWSLGIPGALPHYLHVNLHRIVQNAIQIFQISACIYRRPLQLGAKP